MYSINVFLTFTLSQFGMVRHWWLAARSAMDSWIHHQRDGDDADAGDSCFNRLHQIYGRRMDDDCHHRLFHRHLLENPIRIISRHASLFAKVERRAG